MDLNIFYKQIRYNFYFTILDIYNSRDRKGYVFKGAYIVLATFLYKDIISYMCYIIRAGIEREMQNGAVVYFADVETIPYSRTTNSYKLAKRLGLC